jgi:hypothetical protein
VNGDIPECMKNDSSQHIHRDQCENGASAMSEFLQLPELSTSPDRLLAVAAILDL